MRKRDEELDDYDIWFKEEREKKIARLNNKKQKSKERSLARRAKEEREWN